MGGDGTSSTALPERVQFLFETSPAAVILSESDGTILGANDRAVEQLGYDREELRSMSAADAPVDVDGDDVREYRRHLTLGDQTTTDGHHRRKDGTTVPTMVGRPGGLLNDLTDRQREGLLATYRAGYFEWPRESTAGGSPTRWGSTARPCTRTSGRPRRPCSRRYSTGSALEERL